VRAGASVDDVVAETGWPADKVARYAEPPLRERAYIVELAQRAYVRGTTGTSVLLDLVADTWRGATWDAYRAEDGRWRVTASLESKQATWIYEPAGRSVQAVDAGASRILGADVPEVEPGVSLPAPPPAPQPVEERPKLVSVPAPPEPSTPSDEPVTPAPVEEPRPSRKGRRGRARVPSWDEILFGATRTED
jgi:hypothetical protein